ncbi:MAG: hypothetical protein H6641_01065 [Caldilineaceae bacterium]|nr:hypothetical protein [Caldilineaceae bacterium]
MSTPSDQIQNKVVTIALLAEPAQDNMGLNRLKTRPFEWPPFMKKKGSEARGWRGFFAPSILTSSILGPFVSPT